MSNSEEQVREKKRERAPLKHDFFDALNAAGLSKGDFCERVGFSTRFIEYYFAGERDSSRLEAVLRGFIEEQVPVMEERLHEIKRRHTQPA